MIRVGDGLCCVADPADASGDAELGPEEDVRAVRAHVVLFGALNLVDIGGAAVRLEPSVQISMAGCCGSASSGMYPSQLAHWVV